jgi:hypothetical protein
MSARLADRWTSRRITNVNNNRWKQLRLVQPHDSDCDCAGKDGSVLLQLSTITTGVVTSFQRKSATFA